MPSPIARFLLGWCNWAWLIQSGNGLIQVYSLYRQYDATVFWVPVYYIPNNYQAIAGHGSSTPYGCGTKGGAEAVIHGVRSYLETTHDGERVVVKLDFKNAFNLLRRDTLLEAVKQHFPQYYNYFWQSYRFASHLICGDEVLSSARGVQQGDPSGPFGYGLATLPLFDGLDCDLFLGYLDDVTLAGTVSKVIAAIQRIEERGIAMGLELNFSKCEFYVLNPSAKAGKQLLELWPDMVRLSDDNFSLLGAALKPAGCEKFLTEKKEQLSKFVQRLSKLPSHYSLFLLKNCLSIPKVLFGLRTSRCYEFPALLRDYDELLRKGVQQLSNVSISEAQWMQMALPVRRGGLGTRRIESLAVCAFLASVYSVQSLVSRFYTPAGECLTQSALECWLTNTKCMLPEECERRCQYVWDTPMIDRDVSTLMLSTVGDERRRAVL